MNRKQRRTKNNGHLHNASMAAQAMVLKSKSLDIVQERTREQVLQCVVIALHNEFGFGHDRMERFTECMKDVTNWLNQIGDEYLADAQATGDRAADKKRLRHDAFEYVHERLRQEAQKYTNSDLKNIADIMPGDGA